MISSLDEGITGGVFMRFWGFAGLTLVASFVACLSADMGLAGSPPAPSMKLAASVNAEGFAKKTRADIIAKIPNHADEPPFMNGEPEHLRVTFDDDKLFEYTDYLQRQLLIYPVQPYQALFKGKERVEFERVISDLKKVIATKSDRGIKQLPMLPSAEAYELFHTQVKYPAFKQGSGIAFLSCYKQEEAPIKNGDLFYTFQGLTKDGKYYVSFLCPVQAKKLAANLSSKEAAKYLSKLARNQFVPSLDVLDRVAQSVSIK
jgi:hypothetical protein